MSDSTLGAKVSLEEKQEPPTADKQPVAAAAAADGEPPLSSYGGIDGRARLPPPSMILDDWLFIGTW